MNKISVLPRYWWILLLLVFTRTSYGQSSPPENTSSVSLAPAANLDEQLFILYKLDDVYLQWPSPETDTNAIASWINDQKFGLNAIKDHAWDLNPTTGILVDDCLLLLDHYQQFLIKHNLVNSAMEAQQSSDLHWDIGNVIFDGAQAALESSHSGTKDNDSGNAQNDENPIKQAFSTMGMDAVKILTQRMLQKNHIEEAEAAATEFEINSLKDELTLRVNQLQNVANRMASSHNWGAEDIDFKSSQPNRPLDPFIQYRALWAQEAGQTNKTADGEIAMAEHYLTISQLVPSGDVYWPFRGIILYRSAEAAADGCSSQLKDGNYSDAPAAYSARAISICNAAISIDPNHDPSQLFQEQLARSYGDAGRYKDAADLMGTLNLRQNDDSFLYRQARVNSLCGNTDTALSCLKQSFYHGWPLIKESKNDADLKAVRDAFPAEFDKLTEVRSDWKSEIGTFENIVTFKNDSDFILTRIRLTVNWKNTDNPDQKRSATFNCDSLQPQYTATWRYPNLNAASWVGETATLSCDQN